MIIRSNRSRAAADDHRPDVGLAIGGIAHPQFPGLGREGLGPGPGVADDVDPLDGHAGLAAADERRPGQRPDRAPPRCVGKDDRRIEAGELGDRGHAPGPQGGQDATAVLDAAGEDDLVEVGVDQRLADLAGRRRRPSTSPAGTPASSRLCWIFCPVLTASSDGFQTTALPAARAWAIGGALRNSG